VWQSWKAGAWLAWWLIRPARRRFPIGLSKLGAAGQTDLIAVEQRSNLGEMQVARFRRLVVHAAVGAVSIGCGTFGRNGLYALTTLGRRCAHGRMIKRCRPVATCESRGGECSGSGNQQGGNDLALHDQLQNISTSVQDDGATAERWCVCNVDGGSLYTRFEKISLGRPTSLFRFLV
jgi:hypothetical protein